MPEFQTPKGDKPIDFDKLAPFVQGYIEAMFFTECHSDNEELEAMMVACMWLSGNTVNV